MCASHARVGGCRESDSSATGELHARAAWRLSGGHPPSTDIIQMMAMTTMAMRVVEWIQSTWSEVVKRGEKHHVSAVAPIVGFVAAYLVYLLIYGYFLCPTRHIPGPFLTRFSSAPYYFLLIGGKGSMKTHALHQKYGNYMLSFTLSFFL